MDQLTRYFISRILGHGVVTVALGQDGRGSADIRCEDKSDGQRARYTVDLAGSPPPAASREDLLYQICRRAISQLQLENRLFRPRRSSSVLDLAILPWNGDLYDTPPLSASGRGQPINGTGLYA